MLSQTPGYNGKIHPGALNGIMGCDIAGYPSKLYDSIVEYLNEIKKFRGCWDSIWSMNKFRFGLKASDLAVRHTFPIIKKLKAPIVWDLGAGNGRDSLFFAKFCREVACVEISKAAADTIQEQAIKKNIGNMSIINDDVWSALKMQNSLKKGFVDVVHAHSFLHYTKSIMTDIIFSEIRSLLRKGGRIVFAVKGKGDHLFGKGKKTAKDTWTYKDGQRRKFYNEDDLRLLLERMDFRIELLRTEKEIFDNKISEFVIGVAGRP